MNTLLPARICAGTGAASPTLASCAINGGTEMSTIATTTCSVPSLTILDMSPPIQPVRNTPQKKVRHPAQRFYALRGHGILNSLTHACPLPLHGFSHISQEPPQVGHILISSFRKLTH